MWAVLRASVADSGMKRPALPFKRFDEAVEGSGEAVDWIIPGYVAAESSPS